MPTVYSHSRLSCFENCPKQFHYRYIEKIPAETESIEAFVGKRVHEVLERLHQFVDRGLVPSMEKVISRFHALWGEQFDAERVRIVRSDTDVDFYREAGERCLANHYRRHYPFDADETLGLERWVTVDLDADRKYRLRGIIDRLVRAADGAIEIHDYKTSRRIPTQRALDEDRQLALYQLAVANEFGSAVEIRLVWHYLLFGQTRTSVRSPEQLDSLRKKTIRLIDRIETEQDYEARTGPLCSWCEYQDRCPAFAAKRRVVIEASDTPSPGAPASQLDLL